MDVKWYDNNSKSPIPMNTLTSGTIIVPAAQGWLRVKANTMKGYIDMSCFTLSISRLLYCMKSSCQRKL